MASINIKFNLTGIKEATSAINKSLNKPLEKVQKNLKEINKSFKSILPKLKRGFDSLKRSVFSLNSAFVALGAGLFLRRIINEAATLENALLGLNTVAKNTGQDIEFVNKAAKELASDGVIPLSEVTASLKNLLASGVDAPKAVKAFKALRDAAAFNRQGQLELGQAVRGATDGIKNQLSRLVDNAGITKNLSILVKEYAASVGKSTASLSEQEKQLAIVNGVIREAAIFTGDYQKSLFTFTGQVARASGSLRFLLADLGESITKNPQVIKGIEKLGDGFNKLRKFVNENKTALTSFVTTAGIGILKLVGLITKSILKITELALKAETKIKAVSTSIFDRIFKRFVKDTPFSKVFSKLIGDIDQVERKIKSLTKELEDAGNKPQLKERLKEEIRLLKSFQESTKVALDEDDKRVSETINFIKSLQKEYEEAEKAIIKAVKNTKKTLKKELEGKEEVIIAPTIDTKKFLEDIKKAKINLSDVISSEDFKANLTIAPAFIGFTTILQKGAKEFVKQGALIFGKLINDQTGKVLENFKSVLNVIFKGPIKAFETIGNFFTEKFPKVVSSLESVFKGIGSFFTSAFSKLGSFFSENLPSLVGFFTDIIEGISEVFGSIGGPIGEIIAEIIEIFSLSPDQFNKLITDTIAGIPEILANVITNGLNLDRVLGEALVKFIDNIPMFVERVTQVLVENLADPIFWIRIAFSAVGAFIRAIPKVIQGFINGFRRAGQNIGKQFSGELINGAIKFGDELVNQAGRFIEKLIDEIKNIGGGFLSGAGDFLGGIASSVGGVFGFNKGGFVGGKSGVDKIPAMLTAGEFVVPSDNASNVVSIANGELAMEARETNMLLKTLIGQMGQGQNVSTSVSLNEDTFANIILKLNRNNARLSA